MLSAQFIESHSRLIENVIEHGFIYDISCELLRRNPPQAVDILRAEVDRNGVDLVLSSAFVTHQVQMKARSNKPASAPYAISDSIWGSPGGCVIWIIYDAASMKPLDYYLLGCPLPSIDTFRDSDRAGFRKAWTRNANHKRLTLSQLAGILFP
jgi:hypothetical protein